MVETVLARDLRIDILFSVTQLHGKVNGALQTTGLNDPGALEHVAGLNVPAQYGDHVSKFPKQHCPLLQVGGLDDRQIIRLLHVDGLNPDGWWQKPNGGFLLPVLALLKTIQFPGVHPPSQPVMAQFPGVGPGKQQTVPGAQFPTAF